MAMIHFNYNKVANFTKSRKLFITMHHNGNDMYEDTVFPMTVVNQVLMNPNEEGPRLSDFLKTIEPMVDSLSQSSIIYPISNLNELQNIDNLRQSDILLLNDGTESKFYYFDKGLGRWTIMPIVPTTESQDDCKCYVRSTKIALDDITEVETGDLGLVYNDLTPNDYKVYLYVKDRWVEWFQSTTTQQLVEQVDLLISAKHTHLNKPVIDNITDDKFAQWDSAFAYSHDHSNKSVIDGITTSKVNKWDTRPQSLVGDIDDAVDKRHVHPHKTALDTITSTMINNWNAGISGESAHTHENKDTLDTITPTMLDNWDIAFENNHIHSNENVLNSITQDDLDAIRSAPETPVIINTDVEPIYDYYRTPPFNVPYAGTKNYIKGYIEGASAWVNQYGDMPGRWISTQSKITSQTDLLESPYKIDNFITPELSEWDSYYINGLGINEIHRGTGNYDFSETEISNWSTNGLISCQNSSTFIARMIIPLNNLQYDGPDVIDPNFIKYINTTYNDNENNIAHSYIESVPLNTLKDALYEDNGISVLDSAIIIRVKRELINPSDPSNANLDDFCNWLKLLGGNFIYKKSKISVLADPDAENIMSYPYGTFESYSPHIEVEYEEYVGGGTQTMSIPRPNPIVNIRVPVKSGDSFLVYRNLINKDTYSQISITKNIDDKPFNLSYFNIFLTYENKTERHEYYGQTSTIDIGPDDIPGEHTFIPKGTLIEIWGR